MRLSVLPGIVALAAMGIATRGQPGPVIVVDGRDHEARKRSSRPTPRPASTGRKPPPFTEADALRLEKATIKRRLKANKLCAVLASGGAIAL